MSIGIRTIDTQPENEIQPFSSTLADHGIRLVRDETSTLQINTGLKCDQVCRHCHVNAGPGRVESMNFETAAQVVEYARSGEFAIADITGGAPELNPNLPYLIKNLAPITEKIILRSNLSALGNAGESALWDLLPEYKVGIMASFPSLNENQTNHQRGEGIFNKSITLLKKLNNIGYGKVGTGLELNLISNPVGAFLSGSQEEAEARCRKVLKDKWDIDFDQLFSLNNVPLGRFKTWLIASGNYDSYMAKLVAGFNPCAAEAVMCKSLVSVSWDGYLFDCDFNLAAGLFLADEKKHITDMTGPPKKGSQIAVADHCYTCTAGSGFT